MFFSSLIRRLHCVRAIDEERARAQATHDLAIARSAFLAKVSHELRSPLQGIVSALDLIEMRHARAFAGDEELIGRMRRSSMLLNTQLRDLLTLAKGEAGRLRIHAEPFEACALVEAMAAGARELAVSKGLQLRVALPPAPLVAVADGARIDQVLTNLVVNSIRYTDTGEVRVSMESQGDPPASLRFVVADTGPGIPEDVLPTLFEPDRFITTPARRGEGSGIGLAIVRTLVDRLGGSLRVTSALGRGTIFTVDIPAEFEAPGRADFPDTDRMDELATTRDAQK
ncbi:MAG: HAMP domain-containing sensor histidine kinase [Caldimonas sp.]